MTSGQMQYVDGVYFRTTNTSAAFTGKVYLTTTSGERFDESAAIVF